jgi:opacity protein-like surface antigen
MMKKTIIALSAVLLASPVFAATTHATDDTVAAAAANANDAKQKLHEEQNKGEELKLKKQHAAEGKSESFPAR